MVGKGLKATGRPGDALYDYGAQMQANANERGALPENQLDPSQHSWLTNALASGGEMLAPSVAGMVAAAPLAVAGAPAAVVLGAGALTSGALFGASQFQETYENVKNSGASDDDAFKAGVISGGIEGVGEGIASAVGAKFATTAGRAVVGSTLDQSLKGMAKPGILRPFLGSYAKTLAVETGTEVAQNAGEAQVEKSYGVKEADPIAAGMAAVAPTFGLTTLLAPFGVHAAYRQAGQIKQDVATLTNPNTSGDFEGRANAVNRLGTLLDNSPPPGMAEHEWASQVQDWRMTALEAANAGQPVEVGSLLDGAFANQIGQFKDRFYQQQQGPRTQEQMTNIDPLAPNAANTQVTDDFGNVVGAPGAEALVVPVTKGAVVDFNGTPATVKRMAADGSATLELDTGLTVDLPVEQASKLIVATPSALPAAATSAHPSGVAAGDSITTPHGTGIASIAGNMVKVRMEDGTTFGYDKSHYDKLSSKDPVVQARLDAIQDGTTAVDTKKTAKKATTSAAQPTTTGGQNGQGQKTTEVLSHADAIKTIAKAQGVNAQSAGAAAKKLTEYLAKVPADQHAAEAQKFATLYTEAPGATEAQAKVLQAYATQLQGAQNGQAPNVSQGTESQPAAGQAGSTVPSSSEGSGQGNDAAESLLGNRPVREKGKPVRQKVTAEQDAKDDRTALLSGDPAALRARAAYHTDAGGSAGTTPASKKAAAQHLLKAFALTKEAASRESMAASAAEEATKAKEAQRNAAALAAQQAEIAKTAEAVKAQTETKEQRAAAKADEETARRQAERAKRNPGVKATVAAMEAEKATKTLQAPLAKPAKGVAEVLKGAGIPASDEAAKEAVDETKAASKAAVKDLQQATKERVAAVRQREQAQVALNAFNKRNDATPEQLADAADAVVKAKEAEQVAVKAEAQARTQRDESRAGYVDAKEAATERKNRVREGRESAGQDGFFGFELFDYDEKAPHASGHNLLWVNSVLDAMHASTTEGERATEAKQALDYLKAWYGDSVLELAETRMQQIEKTLGLQRNMRETIAVQMKNLQNQMAYEHKMELLEDLKNSAPSAADIRGFKMSKRESTKLADDYAAALEKVLGSDGDTLDNLSAAARAYTAPRIQAALVDANGRKSLEQVLQVAGMATSNPALKKLVPMLRAMGVSGIGVKYEDRLVESGLPSADGTFSYKRGNFNSSTNELTIYQGGENAHVIAHETVHGLTVNALRRAEAITGTLATAEELRLVAALHDLKALYGFLENNPALQGEYAFKNHAEFLAEALSNPSLQEKLRTIAVPQGLMEGQKSWFQSLYDAFAETIKNFLGLSGDARNALAAAIDASTPFLGPNTTVTAPRLMAQSKALSAQRRAEASHDMIALSPSSALAAPGKAVTALTSAADRWVEKVDFSNAKAKVREAALYVSSTKHIQRMVENSPILKTLHQPIGAWFTADQAKTRVIEHVTAYLHKHLNAVEAALNKTGDFAKLNAKMDFIAREQSMIADQTPVAIDPAKDFAGNKAAYPALKDELKERIDGLNRDYTKMAQTHPELTKLIGQGFLVNRKAYVQNTASLLLSALQQHKMSPSSTSYAAEAVLNKFGKLLDIDVVDTSHKLVDSAKFMDARTEELDTAIRDAFAMVDTKFGGDDMQKSLGVIHSAFKRAVDKPYQFINRPGKYFAGFDVTDTSAATVAKINKALDPYGVQIGGFPGNSKHVYLHLESPNEMQAAIAAVKGLGAIIDQKSVNGGLKSDAGKMENAFGASQAISKLRDLMVSKYDDLRQRGGTNPQLRLAYDQAVAMVNESLVDMLEADSARTTMTRRAGTPGSDSNYRQTFAKRSEYYVSLISNQYAKPKFDEAFRQMSEAINKQQETNPMAAVRGQEVADELAIRHANAMHPVDSPIIDAMKAFGYHFYLSMSPAFVMVNLVQPYHLTLPLLGGRFGFVKSGMAMMNATHLASKILYSSIKNGWAEGGLMGVVNAELDLSKAGLSKSQIGFVQEMIKSGTVDFTQAHEIGRMADGKNRGMANAAKAIGVLTHYSEVMNRLTAGLAAFNLATEMPTAKRTAYAIDAVNQTQFLYSDHNTARVLGRHGFAGKVTPLAASFQNYSFQMMEHYIRLADQGFIRKLGTVEEQKAARKAMYGTLGATTLLAGTMGLPFASVISAALNAVSGDDDKEDVRSQYRTWVASVFGKDMGEIIAKGAPRAAGFDMSARAGHQDLLPGSRFLADRRAFQDKIKDGSMSMMGPAINAAVDVLGGMQHFAEGDMVKGFETMLPAALKGYYKAAQLASSGSFTNAKGNELPMPVDNWDILEQSLGFTPSKKAEQSEANFYYQSATNLTKQAKAQLVNQAVKAYEGGQMDDFGQAMQTITEYNYRIPTSPITDVAEKLVGRARGRAFAAATGTGIIDPNVKHLPRISEYSWANTGIRP
jgi:hypothetical protein